MSYYNLDETYKTIKQPKGLKVKLRPHQLTAISAMEDLETQASIIIDKPTPTSGLYRAIVSKIDDDNEITDSTFVIETNSAILADKPGSGKTYMMIGLILHSPTVRSHDRFILGTDHFSIKMITTKESVPVNLIAVPHNLANQWGQFMDNCSLKYLKLNTISDFDIFFDIDYVDKQSMMPDYQLVMYRKTKRKAAPITKKNGSKAEKKTSSKIIYERLRLNPKKIKKVLDTVQAIVLNINRYKFFKQIFMSTKWARVIIDEMDSASIPSMFNEFGCFNWFLTATPTSIFYKSCRRYVNKIFGYNQNLLQYFIVKNNDEYVDKSVVLPKPAVFVVNTQLQKVISTIRDLIPNDVMSLINAGNMREAVAKLNCDVDTEENIVKVLTGKVQTELHNFKKELAYVKSLIPADKDAHDKRIAKIETDIERCKTKLETINERIKSIKDECCFICADTFVAPTILDCCKSVFCLKCLLQSLKSCDNKCPYCRRVVKPNEYHVIDNGSGKKKEIVKKSVSDKIFNKMDKSTVLEEILKYISKNERNPKILIFSDYSQTFEKITENISNAKLKYSLLSGIPAHISNVINDFKAGNTNILMLDSQHYGSGLNLQDADYLILYHRMTPELETQVIGRAQRFGRKKTLRVIYLVNSSENCTTKLTSNPYKLESADELWMVTDPPKTDDVEEHIDSRSSDDGSNDDGSNDADDDSNDGSDDSDDDGDNSGDDSDNSDDDNSVESSIESPKKTSKTKKSNSKTSKPKKLKANISKADTSNIKSSNIKSSNIKSSNIKSSNIKSSKTKKN